MHKSNHSLFTFRIHMFHLHRNIPEGGEAERRCFARGIQSGRASFPEGGSEFMG